VNTFASAPAALPRVAALDPSKRVNYTLGMVLGVDDFDQESLYARAQNWWLTRELSGYGTIWGLRVTVNADASGPRLRVEPGVAATICGRLACVTPAQCADLNEWLAAHQADLLGSPPIIASPPETLALYVVLCTRDCLTDDVPIPGEPCRTEDRLMAPSRVKDDFRLELRTSPPQQPEEDAIRDFVAWLTQIPVDPGPGTAFDAFLADIRAAAQAAIAEFASPPASPPQWPVDLMFGPPPAGLAIPADDHIRYMRAALGLWVTELRPSLRHALPGCDGAGCGCGGGEHGGGCCCGDEVLSHAVQCGDDAVLLARLDLPVVAGLDGAIIAADSGWAVDESARPYVLHTRFVQEWLMSERAGAPTSPPEPAPDPGPVGSPPDVVAPPIDSVTAHEVVGPPTAAWDAVARALDLGIPQGAEGVRGPGITAVTAAGLPNGAPPTAALNGESLALGIPAGAPGPGITAVTATQLPANSSPTANLAGTTLQLGIPEGRQGEAGVSPGEGLVTVVAAGHFLQDDNFRWRTKGLQVVGIVPQRGLYYVAPPDFDTEQFAYVFKGTCFTPKDDVERVILHTFELVLGDFREEISRAFGGDPPPGVVVRVVGTDGRPPAEFQLEVTRYAEVERGVQ
jgi:hypothetical protein